MAEAKNVFISWSGPRSKSAAEALKEWLPLVVPTANPWMSATDIDKGTRWRDEVATALDTMKAGIICLTPENLTAEWLLFEAGALSKTRDPKTRVWTLLLAGLTIPDLTDPLAMFNATKAEEADTRKLVHSINTNLDATLPESSVNHWFDKSWPDLKEKLDAIPTPSGVAPPKRPPEEMLAEILELTRAGAQSRKAIEGFDEYIPIFKQFMPMLAEVLKTAQKQATPQGSPAREGLAEVPIRRVFRVKQHDDGKIISVEGVNAAEDGSGQLFVVDEHNRVIARFANVEQWWPGPQEETVPPKPDPARKETWVSRALKKKIEEA